MLCVLLEQACAWRSGKPEEHAIWGLTPSGYDHFRASACSVGTKSVRSGSSRNWVYQQADRWPVARVIIGFLQNANCSGNFGFPAACSSAKQQAMRLFANNLCVERAGRQIVSNISFDLKPGDALVVTGPNGSGKSTLLRAIAGLLPISDGSITVKGGSEYPHREDCHYLGHQNGLKAALTVKENLEFWQKFCGSPGCSIESALGQLDLSHTVDLPVGYLSAGQKRRVAIARLLATEKPFWIVDEPTVGLDKSSATLFTGIVKTFCASGGILIAATHLPLGITKPKTLDLGVHAGELV